MSPVSPDSFFLQATPGGRVAGGFLCSHDSDEATVKGILPETAVLQVKQVHGNNIVPLFSQSSVSHFLSFPQEDRLYDGLTTDQAGYALIIRTADCVPILFYSKEGSIKPTIGALHCGWRSLASGILENLSTLDTNLKMDDLVFFIGPAICKRCYEVGEEVVNQFREILDLPSVCKSTDSGKFLLDLKALSHLLLVRKGIPDSAITVSPLCTKCHPAYHSYRENQTGKRNLSFIAITRSSNPI